MMLYPLYRVQLYNTSLRSSVYLYNNNNRKHQCNYTTPIQSWLTSHYNSIYKWLITSFYNRYTYNYTLHGSNFTIPPWCSAWRTQLHINKYSCLVVWTLKSVVQIDNNLILTGWNEPEKNDENLTCLWYMLVHVSKIYRLDPGSFQSSLVLIFFIKTIFIV